MQAMKRVLWAATAVTAIATTVQAADVSGAGATFPYPVYAKWADAYKKQTGVGLNYQSIGSGGGIKQIKAKTVTFGASDAPLEPKDLEDSGLVQFPMIIGGVIPVVNVKGIRPGELTIDGPTLAAIFLGTITKWDDPALKKLNPQVKLPTAAIAVVHRSDGSGTTFLFSSYLGAVSPEWKQKVGVDKALDWPVGIGGKGNEGVAGFVTQTEGSIGYVEYAYVKQNQMTYMAMVNKDGKKVAPKSESFQAAAASADWAKAPGYYLVLTNQAGAGSWPITGASFILMQKQPPDAAATLEALKFFAWAFKSGGPMAAELDYVPLPAGLITQVEATWKSQIKANGVPVWKGP